MRYKLTSLPIPPQKGVFSVQFSLLESPEIDSSPTSSRALNAVFQSTS